PKSHPYWGDIQFSSAYSIVVGYGGGLFGPNDTLTRAQAAVIVTKVFGMPLPSSGSQVFTDVPTNHWAFPYIQALIESGFTAGCSTSPKKFCPDDLVTRGQLAVFFARGLGHTPAYVPGSPHFSDVPASHFSYPFVEYLASKGIQIPCASGSNMFCPDAAATRGETTRFIFHAIASL